MLKAGHAVKSSERSTAKYCCLSHRVLEFCKRRKAQLAEPKVVRDLLDDRQHLCQKAVVRNAVMHKTSKQLFIVFLSIHSSIKRIFYGGINGAEGDKVLMTGNETTICLTLACSPHIITNFSGKASDPARNFAYFHAQHMPIFIDLEIIELLRQTLADNQMLENDRYEHAGTAGLVQNEKLAQWSLN